MNGKQKSSVHVSVSTFSIPHSNTFVAYQEFQKKREAFISHNEIMNEIKKLSADQSVNSLSDDSFGSYAVKEEIEQLSSKWSKIDAIFTDLNNQMASMIDHQTHSIYLKNSTIYLEPLNDMEQRLQKLRSQEEGKKSNIDDISTNLNITRLAELISSLKNFETLEKNVLSQINDAGGMINKAKLNIDKMESETVLTEDERHLSGLLRV